MATASPSGSSAVTPSSGAGNAAAPAPSPAPADEADPILCGHCGRTARNGIACQGMCVADSGY